MVVSLVFNGYFYAYEEMLFRKYELQPIEMVGYEGIYGLPACALVILVLSIIPCNGGQFCVYNSDGVGHMESVSAYLSEVFSSFFLFFLVISSAIAIPLYNFYGVTVTKVYDSLTRSLLNVCRTALLWLVGIIISLFAAEGSYYQI